MSGVPQPPRSVRLCVICATAVIVAWCWVGSSPAAAAGSVAARMPPAPRVLDVVRSPARIRAKPLSVQSTAAASLVYHGGAVLNHGVRLHLVLWDPSGTGFPAGYGAAVSTYLTDVAAASGSSDNVFSVLTQYYDRPGTAQTLNYKIEWTTSGSPVGIIDTSFGSIAYRMTFAGMVTDNTPYPANGCTDPQGRAICLTDAQIRSETDAVASAQGWTPGFQDIAILITPPGVGSCNPTGCAGTDFCGYHTQGNGVPVQLLQIYVPDLGSATCQSTDYVLTHEISETVTDPQGNAWFSGGTANGGEVGDLCESQTVTETVNGDSYAIEPNWSQADGACEGAYANATDPPSVQATIPGFVGVASPANFTLSPQVNEGTLAAVSWEFGDGATAAGSSVSHPYSGTGTYLVTGRAADTLGAFTYQAGIVNAVDPPTVTVTLALNPNGVTIPLGGDAAFQVTGSDSAPNPRVSLDFGDGSSTQLGSTSGVVFHRYSSVGTYTVTATITDASTGLSASSSTQVQIVNNPSTPPAPVNLPPPTGIQFGPPPVVQGPSLPYATVAGSPHASGRTVGLTISCAGPSGATCVVRLTLKKGKFIGSATMTLFAGQSATIRVSLNRTGMRLLAKHHSFTATLTAVQSGHTVFVSPVTFNRPKRKRGSRAR